MSRSDHDATATGREERQATGGLLTAPLTASSAVHQIDDRTGSRRPLLSRSAGLLVASAVAVCVMVTVTHLVLLFLYVAPTNTISTQYEQQINAWIYPYFEQNWRLFAPDPQSAQQQVSARTARTAPDGSTQVSDWVDLTAVDDAAIKHDPFPSHTSQNMLRRAWSAYLESHGDSDTSHSERARMLQEYLLNIAAQRLAARGDRTFDAVQLRVITTSIGPAPAQVSGTRPAQTPSNTRYLPWWQVRSRDH
ncbi:hypothetical protein ABIA32_003145 [Streptacidiphilus sp. MAP12-20]|uniref:DUF5819 family protein n=1 Tax=Streptacidiphilus sp. MAP12-20 TaxID=3156299 RepID=UPI00351833E8